ncbi:alpha/beta fold hydrolase [Oharaeibacter diazotrophicus]|uniref:Alpha-beta hydrolase superfamily lysophospholipase n=2 Tax=Oharaeibacter diazotrophicus TaxID=1920512 RepID=A0A4R6RJZ1_9HYPH|nr:alpha/beta fold hydrolase [Oharaeibacter diazotrophicus]TDP86961.1 alpha-beta hydrolase superfamily lysophospholipase [Oharaeibacter diazotrophicus]BBE71096.1 alpha/beta hydrolase family protein [Pleomorphomonas sp. SM30]GLS77848.1 hypothetical protein GCM10007904_31850 [Oharaeibacter diazotrophicus]
MTALARPAAETVAAHDEGLAATAVAGGLPIAFEGCAGFLHPGAARRGVVMVASIGYEAHCVSETWRALAGAFAGRGLPTLRYDLPGTFDSLGDHLDPGHVARWTASVGAAAAALRRHAGVDEIVLVGFGVGAALAAAAAPGIAGVSAMVLLAPVLSGREYAREMTVWSRLIDDYLGHYPEDVPDGGLSVAGFRFTAETLQGLKALKPAPFPGVARVLAYDKPGRDSGAAIRAIVGEAAVVECRPFSDYGRLTFDPTAARPPADLLADLSAFAADGLAAPARRAVPTAPPAAELRGDGFRERAFRFGPDGRLFGVETRPAEGRPRAAVILLNTGRSRHTGWARAAVEQGRMLARAGVAVLRFDVSSVGDSLSLDDREVLYADHVDADVTAAIDVAAAEGVPVVLAGGCSGAFLAFRAAAQDPRVRGVVLVNPQRFVWDPRERLDVLIAAGTRTVSAQAGQALSLRQWRRLVSGEIRVGRIAAGVARQLAGLAEAALVRRGLPVSGLAPVRAEIVRRFRVLAERGVPVRLIYGADDKGLEELARHFGRHGLVAYPNAAVSVIATTDHNLTPVAARSVMLGAVEDVVEIVAGRASP